MVTLSVQRQVLYRKVMVMLKGNGNRWLVGMILGTLSRASRQGYGRCLRKWNVGGGALQFTISRWACTATGKVARRAVRGDVRGGGRHCPAGPAVAHSGTRTQTRHTFRDRWSNKAVLTRRLELLNFFVVARRQPFCSPPCSKTGHELGTPNPDKFSLKTC